jgi:hypothetical protein
MLRFLLASPSNFQKPNQNNEEKNRAMGVREELGDGELEILG